MSGSLIVSNRRIYRCTKLSPELLKLIAEIYACPVVLGKVGDFIGIDAVKYLSLTLRTSVLQKSVNDIV